MAEIAPKNTYAMEDIGGGVMVRRRVVAGQRIPDHYVVEGGRKVTPLPASEPSPSPDSTSGTEPSPTTGVRRRRRGEPTAGD
jgi:hypothetical protein